MITLVKSALTQAASASETGTAAARSEEIASLLMMRDHAAVEFEFSRTCVSCD